MTGRVQTGTWLWRRLWTPARRAFGGRTASPGVIWAWHRVGRALTGILSPLVPPDRSLVFDVKRIVDGEARDALRQASFSRWGMDVEVLNRLVVAVRDNRCRHILEFGSGISTVVLALACRRNSVHESDKPYVVSIDEDERYAEQSRAFLSKCGLSDAAVVLVRPLVERRLGAHGVRIYDWSDEVVSESAGSDWRADALFVDGPSSGGVARAQSAIDGFTRGAPGCRLFMDDGLRVFELECMRLLQRERYISCEGVIPVGKGLLVGRHENWAT